MIESIHMMHCGKIEITTINSQEKIARNALHSKRRRQDDVIVHCVMQK